MASAAKFAECQFMVGKVFTIAAFVAVASGIATAQAQTDRPVSAQAVARATILRPAILRIGPNAPRLELAMRADMAIGPKRTIRLCDAANPVRCTLIVFDLP
ncbi:hypothetical protein D3Y57_11665 [Sphingomonas paeninsulae]|uniref:UrcA family protein n=2 Tax=Sphingomonas paeninsulae TaxID=2319844 RepID=A0A494TAX2_SPHPE|nr:hypothetical protein D3Y57_11665 [Sphingomonas paeninsulae]